MAFAGDSIYWVEVEKVVPNPFQPRREFDENKLKELGESIRMYGVLQPLTVTRKEIQREDGTFYSEYELIAGERRLRASKLAGVAQVPVIIREGEQSEQEKLELAIIENLQREDLNAIDRALAFQQLAQQFELTHTQVAQKVGRSREYVANSIRLLNLPEHMRTAVQHGELGEGHARTLLMLSDKPEEQETIFRETLLKKLSVRELERIARKIAHEKVRKPHKEDIDEHLIEIEKAFTETLGTRVQILKTEFGGRLTIDYFSDDDLDALLQRMKDEREAKQSGAALPGSHSLTEPQAQHEIVDRLAAATPLAAAPEASVPHRSIHEVQAAPHTPYEQHQEEPSAPALAPIPPKHERTAEEEAPAWPISPAPQQTPSPSYADASERRETTLASESTPASPNEPKPIPPNLPTENQFTPRSESSAETPAGPESIQTTQPPEKEPQKTDEDDDLYSLRNFSV